MTNETLLETYQSVKELIADNLQEKGVNASSNDGLTTLAGKILDIQESEETPEETKTINCKVVWNDNSNDKEVRPNSIKVFLYKDGEIYKSQTISNSNSYQCQFTNCPVNHTYTIEFSENYYYTQEILEEGDSGITNGFDFQCNYTVKTGTLIISSTISLPEVSDPDFEFDDVSPYIRFILTGSDPECPINVSYSDFTGGSYQISNCLIGAYSVSMNLPSLFPENYFIKQDSVLATALSLDSNTTSNFSLYLNMGSFEGTEEPIDEPELTDIEVVVIFDDGDNIDLMRPNSVAFDLYKGGEIIDSIEIDASMGWRYTFTELPKYYTSGNLIQYSIQVVPVNHYRCDINNFTATLTYEPPEKSLTVQKVWEDDNNSQGARPTTLTVTLKRNNENYTTALLTEENNWSATTSVPIYYNGEEAEYSWTEGEISNYVLQETVTQGNTTTLTNVFQIPENPSNPKTPK